MVFLFFLHLVILKKVWFMLLGFSCDGTCLSWIEFIFNIVSEPLFWYIYLKSWNMFVGYGDGYLGIYLDVILIYILDIVDIDLGVYLDCCIV